MENGLSQLEQLGFSRYEGRAYIALLRASPLNGYELAKSSGVPRPNIYAVLRKLEGRGAVLRLDTSSGTRYAPVPISELIVRQQVRMKEILESARESLSAIAGQPSFEYVWNAHGYAAMIEHAHSVLHQTQKQLLVAVSPIESALLENAFSDLEAKGVKIITLCLQHCPPQTCGHCRGTIYRYALGPGQENRWLMAVADNAEVLASELGVDGEALTIRTRQPLFIHLAQLVIRTCIALTAVMNDLDKQPYELLHLETREILNAMDFGEL